MYSPAVSQIASVNFPSLFPVFVAEAECEDLADDDALSSLKGYLKEVVNSIEAYVQEIKRLKGDLITTIQEIRCC